MTCAHDWQPEGDHLRCADCGDELTASQLWQEHGGREVVTTPRTWAPIPVQSEPPWFVQHSVSILILLGGLSVWVVRHV